MSFLALWPRNTRSSDRVAAGTLHRHDASDEKSQQSVGEDNFEQASKQGMGVLFVVCCLLFVVRNTLCEGRIKVVGLKSGIFGNFREWGVGLSKSASGDAAALGR
jgi:hypothetical protein